MNMQRVDVEEESQVGAARRQAGLLATSAGFDATRAGEVALVATELATNLLKHGGGGCLLAGRTDRRIELLALDRGRGMADVAACMTDGYSTAGTRGSGLGAARRLSQGFAVASWPGAGTAVYACFDPPDAGGALPEDLGAVVVAKPGETACGDAWHHHDAPGARIVMVVDGLGHGVEAAIAANAAVTRFQQCRDDSPAGALQALHLAMRPTRGGAVAIARVDRDSGAVAFAGLGNIAACAVGAAGQVRRMVSLNGTAGHNARKIQAFDYACGEGLLIMHSDGIGTGWDFARYPGLWRMPPTLVAGVLYRDHARGRDDAAVVVSRIDAP